MQQWSKVERPDDELPQSYDRPMLALQTNAISEGDGGLRTFSEWHRSLVCNEMDRVTALLHRTVTALECDGLHGKQWLLQALLLST